MQFRKQRLTSSLAVLVLACGCIPSDGRAKQEHVGECDAWRGQYVGKIRADQSVVSAEERNIVLNVSTKSSDMAIGGDIDPEIIISSTEITCSASYIVGHFADNWGTDGKFSVRKSGGAYVMRFSDLKEGSKVNYVGYYPLSDVALAKAPNTNR